MNTMIRSTRAYKLSPHYKYFSEKELRHKAGVAYVKGDLKRCEALEVLARTKFVNRKPGQHGEQGVKKRKYYAQEQKVLLPQRGGGRAND